MTRCASPRESFENRLTLRKCRRWRRLLESRMRTSNERAWMWASALAAVIVLVLCGSVAAQEPNPANKAFFSGPLNLSNDARNTQPTSVRVALDAGGNIDVVWGDDSCQETFPYTCTWHLFFRRSVDGGATFSTPR